MKILTSSNLMKIGTLRFSVMLNANLTSVFLLFIHQSKYYKPIAFFLNFYNIWE